MAEVLLSPLGEPDGRILELSAAPGQVLDEASVGASPPPFAGSISYQTLAGGSTQERLLIWRVDGASIALHETALLADLQEASLTVVLPRTFRGHICSADAVKVDHAVLLYILVPGRSLFRVELPLPRDAQATASVLAGSSRELAARVQYRALSVPRGTRATCVAASSVGAVVGLSNGAVICVDASGAAHMTLYEGGGQRIWSGLLSSITRSSASPVTGVAALPGGRVAAVVHGNGRLRLWSLLSGAVLASADLAPPEGGHAEGRYRVRMYAPAERGGRPVLLVALPHPILPGSSGCGLRVFAVPSDDGEGDDAPADLVALASAELPAPPSSLVDCALSAGRLWALWTGERGADGGARLASVALPAEAEEDEAGGAGVVLGAWQEARTLAEDEEEARAADPPPGGPPAAGPAECEERYAERVFAPGRFTRPVLRSALPPAAAAAPDGALREATAAAVRASAAAGGRQEAGEAILSQWRALLAHCAAGQRAALVPAGLAASPSALLTVYRGCAALHRGLTRPEALLVPAARSALVSRTTLRAAAGDAGLAPLRPGDDEARLLRAADALAAAVGGEAVEALEGSCYPSDAELAGALRRALGPVLGFAPPRPGQPMDWEARGELAAAAQPAAALRRLADFLPPPDLNLPHPPAPAPVGAAGDGLVAATVAQSVAAGARLAVRLSLLASYLALAPAGPPPPPPGRTAAAWGTHQLPPAGPEVQESVLPLLLARTRALVALRALARTPLPAPSAGEAALSGLSLGPGPAPGSALAACVAAAAGDEAGRVAAAGLEAARVLPRAAAAVLGRLWTAWGDSERDGAATRTVAAALHARGLPGPALAWLRGAGGPHAVAARLEARALAALGRADEACAAYVAAAAALREAAGDAMELDAAPPAAAAAEMLEECAREMKAANRSDLVVRAAHAALPHAPPDQQARLWVRVFKFSVERGAWDDAYAALLPLPADGVLTGPDDERIQRRDCVRLLVDGAWTARQGERLCALPRAAAAGGGRAVWEELEEVVQEKAQATDGAGLCAQPLTYYHLAFSLAVTSRDYRRAAEAMADYASRLAAEAPHDSLPLLRRQVQAAAAAAHALALVPEHFQWISAPRPSSRQRPASSAPAAAYAPQSPKRRWDGSPATAAAGAAAGAAEGAGPPLRTLADLRRAYALASGRLTLAERNGALLPLTVGMGGEELALLLVRAGECSHALRLADACRMKPARLAVALADAALADGPQPEGTVAPEEALRALLERRDGPAAGREAQLAAVQRFLEAPAGAGGRPRQLPLWLARALAGDASLFGGPGGDPAGLVREYVRRGALQEAALAAIELLERQEIARREGGYREGALSSWLPYTVLDQLREQLRAAGPAGRLREWAARLEALLRGHAEHVARVSAALDRRSAAA